MKKRAFLLIMILSLVFSTFVAAAPVTFPELKLRVKQRETNLDLLDYDKIYKNIEELTTLESSIKSAEEPELTLKKAKFDELLTETFLMTFESINNETRAIWIDNIYLGNIITKEDVTEMMEWLHSMNFNTIIPDVFNNGKAIYPSKVVPQFDNFYILYKGDILQDMVEEAHRLGMELHPLVVLFGLDTGWEQFLDNIIAFDRDINGRYVNMYGQAFLSPAVPETRDRIINLIKEIVSYDIDGLNLDYVRFSTGFGFGDYIGDVWEAFNGIKPNDITVSSPYFKQYQEFKAQFVSSFVDRAVKEVQTINPKILVSADVQAPYTWGKNDLAQDHRHWTDNRYIHSLMLMSYNYTAEEFSMHIANDAKHIQNQALTLPGMGLYNFDNVEYLRQIEASRGQPFSGQVSFSAIHLAEDKEDFLKKGPYRNPSLSTMNNPQRSASLILEDLALRLELTSKQSGLDEATINSWQEKLTASADSIYNLDLRSWPDRELKKASPKEELALEQEIESLNDLIDTAGLLGTPGHRIALEIQRVVNILEMFKHFASSYSYTPISY